MKMNYVKSMIPSALLAFATLGCMSTAFGEELAQRHEKCPSALEGSWLYTVTIPGTSPLQFTGVETYAAGGGYTEADLLSVIPGYSATAGHGAWKQAGEERYLLTYLNLTYNNGVGTGNSKVRQTMRLTHGGTEYEGSGDFFYYALDGVTVVASGTFTITAKRIEVEKPQ